MFKKMRDFFVPTSGSFSDNYPITLHLFFVLPIIILVILFQINYNGYAQAKIVANEYPTITLFMRIITNYANYLFYIIYALIFYFAYTEKNQLYKNFIYRFLLWHIIISLGIVFTLKNLFGFSRPFLEGAAAEPFAFTYAYNSFPSGHTTEIFMLALPLALAYAKHRLFYICLCVFATLVAFSRLWLQAHYPRDVLAGVILASLGSYLILYKAKNGKKL